MIPQPLQDLIKRLSRLPGLGPRSAQRAVLHLISNPMEMADLDKSIQTVMGAVVTCSTCGNVGLETPCHICTASNRDGTTLCVVEGVDDLWALEKSGEFKGHYHVLGGVISAIDGVGPEDLNIPGLIRRVEDGEFKEIILALGASVDGQTTCHLIARKLKPLGVSVTSLAKGMPVGSDVDYLDGGTLALALQGRREF